VVLRPLGGLAHQAERPPQQGLHLGGAIGNQRGEGLDDRVGALGVPILLAVVDPVDLQPLDLLGQESEVDGRRAGHRAQQHPLVHGRVFAGVLPHQVYQFVVPECRDERVDIDLVRRAGPDGAGGPFPVQQPQANGDTVLAEVALLAVRATALTVQPTVGVVQPDLVWVGAPYGGDHAVG
jgi:hypothetical protein